MSFIADRARVNSSVTVLILDQVKELDRAGQSVISLSAGEPDFVTPEHIRHYATQALHEAYAISPEAAVERNFCEVRPFCK